MTKMRATAVGAALLVSALATEPASAGCNSGDLANDSILHGPGCRGDASGEDSTAVGSGAFARGAKSTVLGRFSGPTAAVAGVTALGFGAGGSEAGPFSTIIGAGSLAVGPRAGAFSIAIGGSDSQTLKGAFASGLRSIAIGQASVAGTGGGFGTSVGFNARSGFAGTAIGTDASALGLLGPVAVGRFAGAGGQQATALGPSANASALRTVALGHAARETHARSVAIGDGSVSGGSDTVSVGTTTKQRRIVNVAAAKKNTDAVNLKQVRDLIRDATRSGAGASASAAITSGLPAGNVAIGRVRHAALAGAARAGAGIGAREEADETTTAGAAPLAFIGWARVAKDGAAEAARAVAAAERREIGRYVVVFERASVRACTVNAILSEAGFVAVVPGTTAGTLEVETRNRFGVLADTGFHLTVMC